MKKPYHVIYKMLDVLCIKAENDEDAQAKAEVELDQLGKAGWEIESVVDIRDIPKSHVAWTDADERKLRIEKG